MAEAQDLKLYNGNCHCGRYRFTLRVPEIKEMTACTCSLCVKQGYFWLVPPDGAFTETRADEGRQTEYESEVLWHKFCNECGTGVLGRHSAGPMAGQMAVSLRALRELDPFTLLDSVKTVELHDERDPPVPSDESVKYVGSCHCKKVRSELLIPLDELEIKEDNCSGCIRNAWMGIYPTKDNVRVYGDEHTYEYVVGKKWGGGPFCATCGVNVYSNIYGPPQSVIDAVPAEKKERFMKVYNHNMSLKPLNTRALDNVDFSKLDIKRNNIGTEGYEPHA